MMAAALLPSLMTGDEDAYFRLFALEMEAALTLAVWLAARTADRLKPGAGDAALGHATLLAAALGVIAVRRYDPTVALAIAAAISALASRRPAMSGAALGLAVALKGVPILLAPIFVMHAVVGRGREGVRSDARLSADYGPRPGAVHRASVRTPVLRRAMDRALQSAPPLLPLAGEGGGRSPPDEGLRRPLASFLAGLAAALALAGLAYALIAGPHALDAFAYHGARPIQVETIYSGFLVLARALDPAILTEAYSYGSLNVVSPAEPALRALSTVLTVAGIVASCTFAWARLAAARDPRARLLAVVQASLACLVAFVTLGKVFSPQYCVWLLPLAAVAAPFASAEARRLLPFAFLMVQAEYPFLYAFLYSTLAPATGALIALRTVWLWRYVGAAAARPANAFRSDATDSAAAAIASREAAWRSGRT